MKSKKSPQSGVPLKQGFPLSIQEGAKIINWINDASRQFFSRYFSPKTVDLIHEVLGISEAKKAMDDIMESQAKKERLLMNEQYSKMLDDFVDVTFLHYPTYYELRVDKMRPLWKRLMSKPDFDIKTFEKILEKELFYFHVYHSMVASFFKSQKEHQQFIHSLFQVIKSNENGHYLRIKKTFRNVSKSLIENHKSPEFLHYSRINRELKHEVYDDLKALINLFFEYSYNPQNTAL